MSLAVREAFPREAIGVAIQAAMQDMQTHATPHVGKETGLAFAGSAESIQLDSTVPHQQHHKA